MLRTTPVGVEAIRTAGSTADRRISALLIELKAQLFKLVTYNRMRCKRRLVKWSIKSSKSIIMCCIDSST